MIYLDNAATTKICHEALDEMMPYLTEEYGNPGAIYSIGRSAKDAVQKARERVADFIGCEPDQVIFTSGGSEGNTLVVRGIAKYMKDNGKTDVITSYGEHESVIRAVMDGLDESLFDVGLMDIKRGGCVDCDALRKELSYRKNTGLVSLMYVNNELGTVNPVRSFAEISHDFGALYHTDCVQAAGTLPLNVEHIGCDFLTISSHKIHGPKGVGAVFARDPSMLTSLVYGSRSQEFGLRGGTENVAGIVGFGKACEVMKQSLRSAEISTSTYKQVFFSRLMDMMAQRGLEHIVHVNGEPVLHNGKILNIRFDGVDAETLILMLDSKGVYLSAGSACHGHDVEPSRVLLAYGLTAQQARSSIRVSFSKMNTAEEVEEAAKTAAECVAVLHG